MMGPERFNVDMEEWLAAHSFQDNPMFQKVIRPECRFCHGKTKSTANNGILGPGYAEWNFVCKDCGRTQ